MKYVHIISQEIYIHDCQIPENGIDLMACCLKPSIRRHEF